MLNKSSDFVQNVQEYWEAKADQLGYSHAHIWYLEELYSFLQLPNGEVVETLPLDSEKFDAYCRIRDLVREFQDCELRILLRAAKAEGGCNVDAVAQSYEESYRDHLFDI